MVSVPCQGLNLPRHAAEQSGVVIDDVPVDLVGESFVVGVRGQVAIIEHLKPDVGFLGIGNEIFREGLFEGGPWPPAFVPLSFEVELEGFPDDFEGELKPLHGGVADEFAFWLGDGFGESGRTFLHIGLPLAESFFAHGFCFGSRANSGRLKGSTQIAEKIFTMGNWGNEWSTILDERPPSLPGRSLRPTRRGSGIDPAHLRGQGRAVGKPGGCHRLAPPADLHKPPGLAAGAIPLKVAKSSEL